MSCSFYVVLLNILAVILQIYQVEGEILCSAAEKEVCSRTGKFCWNNQCRPCEYGYVKVNDECYDPKFAQVIVLEQLENCDPANDPLCKKELEGIRDQLETQLTGNYNKNKIDLTSPKFTKPIVETRNGEKDIPVIESKLNKKIKIHEQQLRKDKNADGRTSGDVDADSMEMLNESETSSLSKKSPVQGDDEVEFPEVYFLIIIIACTLSGVTGIALAGYCWYKLHNRDKNANKSDYIPGVKKTNEKSSPAKNGDRKLDLKAEMYHYVHTKTQIAAMEKAKKDHLGSEGLSHDEEDDVEDYTVYECPGLAPTEDMTVVNPLFSDQEVTGSDEGRMHSNISSPSTPVRSKHSPSR